MPVLTGSLSDIGLQPLIGAGVQLEFTPSGVAVDGNGKVFARKPVYVTPNASGAFSVDLASTVNLMPRGTHWRMGLTWLRGSTGEPTAWDVVPFRLFVGDEPLTLADAIVGDPGAWASLLHVGVEPPAVLRPGLLWIDTSGEVAVVKKWEA